MDAEEASLPINLITGPLALDVIEDVSPREELIGDSKSNNDDH